MTDVILTGEQAQQKFGEELAKAISGPLVFWLQGNLGAGKTTLTRGILRGLGYEGPVKSPTFTLIEPYSFDREGAFQEVYHLDLYRLSDPEELEYLSLRDMLATPAVWIIEWPNQGKGMIPDPDVTLNIDYALNARHLSLVATTEEGRSFIGRISTRAK